MGSAGGRVRLELSVNIFEEARVAVEECVQNGVGYTAANLVIWVRWEARDGRCNPTFVQ